jgi:predicted dehydrogenase
MSFETRRGFLQSSAAGLGGVAAAYWGAVQARAQEKPVAAASPNEQPTFGFIGCGIRLREIGGLAMDQGPCVAICDVDSLQAGRMLEICIQKHGELGRSQAFDVYEDYRNILDRPDVDAVVIATPDHWHTKIAIDAMRAGKDVYCEKPMTLTIREGRQLINVMRETKRVVQVGTQQRTEFDGLFAQAAAMMRDGRVGKVKRVTTAIGGSMTCDPLPAAPPPKTLNWDMWQGQTPAVEYRQGAERIMEGYGAGYHFGRAHNYFRWWYEYSGGKLTDWGAHHVDIALWALDKLGPGQGRVTIEPLAVSHPVEFKDGMPTVDDRFNAATAFDVRVTYADGVELRVRNSATDLGFDNGIMFEGENGRFMVNRGKIVGSPVEELASKPLPADALRKLYGGDPPTSHMGNFVECMKSRRQPASDAESHHRALSICHAVNIAMRLGRTLTFDTDAESFVGDAQANAFVAREQRKGYEIQA